MSYQDDGFIRRPVGYSDEESLEIDNSNLVEQIDRLMKENIKLKKKIRELNKRLKK